MISKRPVSVEGQRYQAIGRVSLSWLKKQYIATLVERHFRYAMPVKVKNKKTESVVSALVNQTKKLPRELYKSLTSDRGRVGRSSNIFNGNRHLCPLF